MAPRKKPRPASNQRLIILIVILLVVFYLYTHPELLNFSKPTAPSPTSPKPTTENAPPVEPENEAPVTETPVSFDFERNADFVLPASTKDDQIVRHDAYALSYAEKYEQAKWVAYRLAGGETRGSSERGNDFRPDPLVETKSALPDDYRGSGYDRGHLAPAADFKDSPKHMSESFYMSNMSPQAPDFNRNIWNDLENQVRRWARRDEAVYVVTGPVLKGKMAYIGKRNKIAVPRSYYKVLLDLTEPETKGIGFLMKNEGSAKPLKSFAVTIDEVEKETGIDFFPQLPADMEKQLEGTVNVDAWFRRK